MTDVSLRYLLFGEDRTASKAVHGVESTATKSGKVIGSSFSKMGAMIGGEVGELLSKAGEGLEHLSESAKGMAPKLAAGGAAVTGLGAALSMMGSKDKEAENALQAALGATGKSIEDYKEEIEKTVKQQENFGHSAADTQNALASLTQATGDPKKALESMGVVADLAASKHISLQSAADMLAKGLNGATKVFKGYGITVASTSAAANKLAGAEVGVENATAKRKEALEKLVEVQGKVKSGALTGAKADDALAAAHHDVVAASKKLAAKQDALKLAHEGVKRASDSTRDAVEQLGKKIDGQAAASVDSFSGRLHVLKTKAEDAVAQFGNKFGPALQVSGAAMMGMAAAMEIGSKMALGTRIQMGLLSIQTAAQAAISKGAAAAQWLLNAAMEANPIGLIVLALVGLVAIFVLLYKHSTTFRNAMNAAFHAVTAAAMWAFDWIKGHWPLILAILTGPFGIAVLLIVKNWTRIKDAAGDAISGVKSLWSSFIGWLTGIPGKIGHATAGMWNGIKDSFKTVLNGVIDIWNSMPSFKIPGFSVAGHKIGGGSIGLPHLNHLAVGGVLTSSGAVVVGEHGREVLDMPAGARVRPLSAMDTHGGGGSGGDLGTLTVDITQDGVVIARKLAKLKRDRGGLKLEFEDA